jgi:hydrogenase/urease accessory protein HupE
VVAFKWTGILIVVVSVTLDVTSNLILVTLTTYEVPQVLNIAAAVLTVIGVLTALAAHLHQRAEARMTRLIEIMIGRVDELETRIGDRNSGFVEGYLLGHGPEASVVPLAPRGLTRRVVTSAED